MAIKNKFSKDPKVKLISITEFLESSSYLHEAKNNLWEEEQGPMGDGYYYKITPKYFIRVFYREILINFGMDCSEILDSIEVALRDGKTEYEIFDKRLSELEEKRLNYNTNKKIDKEIKCVKEALLLLPAYEEIKIHKPKDFNQYLINKLYKTEREELKNKYVVFDVETNGLRHVNDDLLSISIYDPTNGICYNRHLPLDLQPMVLTTWIHGIKEEVISNATHITQEELNRVIEYFHLKDRILLSYSGGKGDFDSSFIINYCKRHGINGFENLKFENIKSLIPAPGYGTEGELTKDNLCKLFGIKGVRVIHSGLNDCILQWKLFEKLYNHTFFFIDNDLYRYNDGYIIPVTYLNKYKELARYAKIEVPYIETKTKLVYTYSFPSEILNRVSKFPTNITGISLENGINSKLKVDKQDNREFLTKNKSKLEYVGSIVSRLTEIPVEAQEDGTMKSLKPEYDGYIKEVNEVTRILLDHLDGVCNYIRNNIFGKDTIMSQELSISEEGKVLALCDLSSKTKVLEIKTFNVVSDDDDESINENIARQLYYQSKGRKLFVLSIVFGNSAKFDFESLISGIYEPSIDGITVEIFEVELKASDPKTIIRIRELDEDEIQILKIIEANPLITHAEIARKTGISPNRVGRTMNILSSLRYIKKIEEKKRKSPWILMRKIDDTKTKYTFDGVEPHIIEE